MEHKDIPYWQLDAISKHSSDAIIIVDTEQRIRFATPNVAADIGFDPTNLSIHEYLQQVLHPDDKATVLNRYDNVVQKLKLGFSDHRAIDGSGNVRYFESRTTPLEGSEDNLTISIIRDVTEKKLMELELERRKNRYEALQNSLKSFSQDLSSVMKRSDLEARLLQEVQMILTESEPQLIQLNSETQDLLGDDSCSELLPYLPQLSIGKIERIKHKYVILIGDRGDHRLFLVINEACTDDEADFIWLETLIYYARMVLESLNVIETLMVQLEPSVQKSETPLWILRLLFNLSEKERLHLSADLHDTVLQDQIVLDRSLKALLLNENLNEDVKNQLQTIEQGLEDTIHQIRSICNELRPPFLRELGLVQALKNLFEYTQTYQSNYAIHFSHDNLNQLSLDEEKTIGIYRIVQELINNATKHSKASTIHFSLQSKGDHLQLDYADDGVGFEMDKLKPSYTNMGLTSMIQRVETLFGKIAFDSKPNHGLKVQLHIPVN